MITWFAFSIPWFKGRMNSTRKTQTAKREAILVSSILLREQQVND